MQMWNFTCITNFPLNHRRKKGEILPFSPAQNLHYMYYSTERCYLYISKQKCYGEKNYIISSIKK